MEKNSIPLTNLKFLNKILWVGFLCFFYKISIISAVTQITPSKKKKNKKQDFGLMLNLFLEKSLNIFKGRMGDDLKVKTESRMMVCFNNYYLLRSSLLQGSSDNHKDLLSPSVYIPEGRSLNLVYYNQDLYNKYGEIIGNEDFSPIADDLRKTIFFETLNYNGIEINNTSAWKEINFLTGIVWLLRKSDVKGNSDAKNRANLIFKIFTYGLTIINFFSNLINSLLDWFFHQLQIGYNVNNPKDNLISLEFGAIFKMIFITNKELNSPKDIPEIFNIAEKIFFTTGISINITFFETRLNLHQIKQTLDDYYDSKDYFSLNIYKPQWNFFGLWQIKYSFLFAGLKDKGIQTEWVIFYPHVLDLFSRVIKNSYQGQFIKPASAINLSHGLKTLVM